MTVNYKTRETLCALIYAWEWLMRGAQFCGQLTKKKEWKILHDECREKVHSGE